MALWWAADPVKRPSFTSITNVLESLRGLQPGWEVTYETDSPNPPPAYNLADSMFSPPLKPGRELPDEDGMSTVSDVWRRTDLCYAESYVDAASISSESYYSTFSHNNTGSVRGSIESAAGTLESDTTGDTDTSEYYRNRRPSPPPVDELASYRRDERRYRVRLQHQFHESRTQRMYYAVPA